MSQHPPTEFAQSSVPWKRQTRPAVKTCQFYRHAGDREIQLSIAPDDVLT